MKHMINWLMVPDEQKGMIIKLKGNQESEKFVDFDPEKPVEKESMT